MSYIRKIVLGVLTTSTIILTACGSNAPTEFNLTDSFGETMNTFKGTYTAIKVHSYKGVPYAEMNKLSSTTKFMMPLCHGSEIPTVGSEMTIYESSYTINDQTHFAVTHVCASVK